jgi:hypothetical protein
MTATTNRALSKQGDFTRAAQTLRASGDAFLRVTVAA